MFFFFFIYSITFFFNTIRNIRAAIRLHPKYFNNNNNYKYGNNSTNKGSDPPTP